MAFPLADVRLTTRRGDGRVQVYPRLLRDPSVLPKVDIAVQYLESMLGRERSDLEPEVLVHFFGDHKLARCMLACLARGYRYHPQRLEDRVSPAAMRRLHRVGIPTIRDLRLAVFDRLNDGPTAAGFLPLGGPEREAVLGPLERSLGLAPGALEPLLFLDAPERARLGRTGAMPKAADVVAQFNVGVLEALLRHAVSVRLELADAEGLEPARSALLGLAQEAGVEVGFELEGANVALAVTGRQDALGTWSRHGRKVAWFTLAVLARWRPLLRGGRVHLALRGREADVTLTDEMVRLLGGPSRGQGEGSGPGCGPVARAFASAVPLMRGRPPGCRVARRPEPQAWAAGVALPEALVRLGEGRCYVLAVESLADAERLAPLAGAAHAHSGDPYLVLGTEAHLAPLRAVAAHVLPVCLPPDPAAVAAAVGAYLAEALSMLPRARAA